MEVAVTIAKETATQLIGVTFRHDTPGRAIVQEVQSSSPAASLGPDGCTALLRPGDQIVAVAGRGCKSAEHAAFLVRHAAAGSIPIVKLMWDAEAVHAARVVQRAWARFRRHSVCAVRCILTKPERQSRLGVRFRSEWRLHSVLEMVSRTGLAHGILHEGDVVRSVNGIACVEPYQTAKLLRESVGRLEIELMPAHLVDLEGLRIAEVDAGIAASTGGGETPTSEDEDTDQQTTDACAVCFELLCEPVRFPGAGCGHYFCRPCMKQLAAASNARACCPLCRAPAVEPLTPRKIVVDPLAAAMIEARHPDQYAECIALHREMSRQLHRAGRLNGNSGDEGDTGGVPSAHESPSGPSLALPVCLGYADALRRMRGWQRGRFYGEPEGLAYQGSFAFSETAHLHAIAHALADGSRRLLMLPDDVHEAGSVGLVATITSTPRGIVVAGRPVATLERLVRRRVHRGSVRFEMALSPRPVMLIEPAIQDEALDFVWSGQVVPHH